MLLFFILLFLSNIFSQEQFDNKYKYANNGEGVEYIFSVPMPYYNSDLSCTVKLYSKFDTKVKITKSNFSKTLYLKANKIESFNLDSNGFVAIFKSNQTLAQKCQVYKNSATQISADKPIKAMLYVKSGNLSESTYLIPRNFCDTSYVLQSYSGLSTDLSGLSPISTIAAFEDSTEININLGGLSSSKLVIGKDTLNFGDTNKQYLNKGDVLVLHNFHDKNFELAGTRISSNKKISILNGNYCSNAPIDTPPCNYMLESALSTNYFGKKFYIPYFKDRYFGGLIRVFTIDNKTKVYEDGKQILSLTNSTPNLKNKSWADYRINEKSSEKKYSVITSDQPIGILYINPSSNDDNSNFSAGIFNILPAELMINYSVNPKWLFSKTNSASFNNTLIAPLKNHILSDGIFLLNNTWSMLTKTYSYTNLFDTDYSLIENLSGDFSAIYSDDKHQLYTIAKQEIESGIINLAMTEYGNLRNLRLIDKNKPYVTFLKSQILDSVHFQLNFTLNDERSEIYRYIINEENTAIIDSFLIGVNSNQVSLSHTITAEPNKNYSLLVYDNSNNYEQIELGKLLTFEEVKDSIIIDKKIIDFGLVQVNDTAEITLDLKLLNPDSSQITSIDISEGENVFSISDELSLPISIKKAEAFKLKLKYTPITEYTKSEYQDSIGFGDFAKLNITTSNGVFTYQLFGKGGIARIYWRYDNNSFVDTLTQGTSRFISGDKFFIQNYNIATKLNGTYDLIIDKVILDSVYNVNFDKIDFKNMELTGRFKHYEDGTFLEPFVLKPGEKVFLNEEFKYVGNEAGSFSFYLPFRTNAINNSEFGILFFEFVVFENTSSVRNISVINYSLNKGILSIHSENKQIKAIKIFDINGREVYSNQSFQSEIDLTSFQNQVLFVQLQFEQSIKQFKVIVE